MLENWKIINGYDNYEISSHGRCRNNKTNRILKLSANKETWCKGYQYVILRKDNIRKNCKIHRLVADAFLENPLNKKYVDHIDNDPKNNKLSNLRWATSKENQGNRSKGKNTSSCYKGVSWHSKNKKWHAQIKLNGKKYHIGSFKNEEDAARAYDEKAREHFGEFAKLNFN